MARNLTPRQIADFESQLADLYKLRAMGAKQVSHTDKTVVLKSDVEIQRAINDILTQLGRSTRTRILKCYTKRNI